MIKMKNITNKIIFSIIMLVLFFIFNPITINPVFSPIADAIGTIEKPPGVEEYSNIGMFISVILRIINIIAGIWSLFNFTLAGFTYITSGGDSSAHQKVSDTMTNTAIGLVIIASSYTLTAVLSTIIFGDPGYILSLTFNTIN